MQASIREDDRINHERRLKQHLDALHNDSMSRNEHLLGVVMSQVALLTAVQKKSGEEEASLAQMYNM